MIMHLQTKSNRVMILVMADNEESSYEELREKVIKQYKILYKDALAMDICEVPKDVRLRLLEDPYYISKTKAIKAGLFVQQLETLDAVLAGSYSNTDKPTDTSGTILKALEMKQKLLLEDLNVTKDESNALNVAFIAMSREDFEAMDSVEVSEGGNSREIGADFGVSEDTDSFEARLKADAKQRLKELEDSKEGENNGNIS